MSRITDAFAAARAEGRAALIVYLTAGDPSLEATEEIAAAVAGAGADIIELGVPFSDPLADGPVIQAAYTRALARGCTLDGVLGCARQITERTGKPVVLMTDWNPVLARGPERFCEEAARSGTAGLLVPDLLPEDAVSFRSLAERAGLDTIFLAAPGMSEERLAAAGEATSGFLYQISRSGVTGAEGGVGSSLVRDVERSRAHARVPIAVGFGVTTPADAARVAEVADGVIVGSAFVEVVHREWEEARLGGAEASEATAGAARAAAGLTMRLLEGIRGAATSKQRTDP